MIRSRRISTLAGSAALALVPAAIGACGGGGATAAAPAKTAAAPPTSIGTGKTALGTILVDSQGRTLYLFTHDSGPTSMCSGACAAAWPPLVATGTPTATSTANGALLGTTRRPDGTIQVTYDRHPLYRFVKDTNAGEINGQGVTAFGGSFFTVNAAGNQVGHRASSAPAKPKAEAPAAKTAPEPAPPKPEAEPEPKPAPKPEPEQKPAPPAAGGIPQNGGGDGDGDNSGGPSDGDGNV
jgi:predicted lipoprotein with Yx(FWY)xxD motif